MRPVWPSGSICWCLYWPAWMGAANGAEWRWSVLMIGRSWQAVCTDPGGFRRVSSVAPVTDWLLWFAVVTLFQSAVRARCYVGTGLPSLPLLNRWVWRCCMGWPDQEAGSVWFGATLCGVPYLPPDCVPLIMFCNLSIVCSIFPCS